MKFKLFTANGASKFSDLEDQVNRWLLDIMGAQIAHTETALCTINDGGEDVQSIVLTVWWEEKRI